MNVLLVDDSQSVLSMLETMISHMHNVSVVGKAHDGDEAVKEAQRLRPDVILLDVEMPGRSGLDALPTLLRVCDATVIMCSSLTKQGAAITLQALERGAFDYIPKEDLGSALTLQAFEERLHAAFLNTQRRRLPPEPIKGNKIPWSGVPYVSHLKLLVVGASTGGPQALQKLFSVLPPLPIPIVVVQHMPAMFVDALAQNLAAHSNHKVVVATPGHNLAPGEVCIAPSGKHLAVRRQMSRIFCELLDEPKGVVNRPSVDVLFQTAAEVVGKDLLALVLTGMGKDGAEGAKTVRQRGGIVLAESSSSCVVYGMPKAVVDNHTANFDFVLPELPLAIIKLVTGRTPK